MTLFYILSIGAYLMRELYLLLLFSLNWVTTEKRIYCLFISFSPQSCYHLLLLL